MSMYKRNSGKAWTEDQVKRLRQYARRNTPTRVIGLKLGRSEASIRSKAYEQGISLKPWNQSPYNRSVRRYKRK